MNKSPPCLIQAFRRWGKDKADEVALPVTQEQPLVAGVA